MPLRLPPKAEIYVGVFVDEHVRISGLQGVKPEASGATVKITWRPNIA